MFMAPEVFEYNHKDDDLKALLVAKGDLLFGFQEGLDGVYIGVKGLESVGELNPDERKVLVQSYFEKLDVLIAARETLEGKSVNDLEYPKGFIEACDAVYADIGSIYKAEEILGCWVFGTTRPACISGPKAVVIATGELIHFHIPALLYPDDRDKDYVQKIEQLVGEKVNVIVDQLCDDDASFPTYPTPLKYWE